METNIKLNINWELCIIGEYRNEDDTILVPITNQYSEEKQNITSSMDYQMLNIINELYYVEGMKRLNESQYENIEHKEALLNELDFMHSDLQFVKTCFYLEVEESQKRLNGFKRLNKKGNNILGEFYYKINHYRHYRYFRYVTNLPFGHFQNINNILRDFIKSYQFEEIKEDNHDVWSELLTIAHKCFYFYERELYNEFLNEVTVFFHFLRDKAFGENDEKIWLLERLRIYNYYLDIINYDEWYRLLDFYDIDDSKFTEVLNKFIAEFDRATRTYQVNICKNMLNLLQYNDFYQRPNIRELKLALMRDNILKEKYLVITNESESSKGCFAIMHIIGDKQYVALSGMPDETNCNLLRKVLRNSYQIVSFDKNVRYYYEPQKYITYFHYEAVQNDLLNKENKQIIPMFSCCERKLLTASDAYNKPINAIIYVKYKPCYKCKRAISASIKKIKIITPTNINKAKDLSRYYKIDNEALAKKIKYLYCNNSVRNK